MRTEVKNQIRMLGADVAAEVGRARDSHRRWLRLGPVDDGVLLLEVEVPEREDPVDFAKGEEDYIVVARETFPSLDAALAAIAARGVNTDDFEAIWKADNPF